MYYAVFFSKAGSKQKRVCKRHSSPSSQKKCHQRNSISKIWYEQKLASIVLELDECFEIIFENCENSDLDSFVTENEQVYDACDEIEFKLYRVKREDADSKQTALGQSSASITAPKDFLTNIFGKLTWMACIYRHIQGNNP